MHTHVDTHTRAHTRLPHVSTDSPPINNNKLQQLLLRFQRRCSCLVEWGTSFSASSDTRYTAIIVFVIIITLVADDRHGCHNDLHHRHHHRFHRLRIQPSGANPSDPAAANSCRGGVYWLIFTLHEENFSIIIIMSSAASSLSCPSTDSTSTIHTCAHTYIHTCTRTHYVCTYIRTYVHRYRWTIYRCANNLL